MEKTSTNYFARSLRMLALLVFAVILAACAPAATPTPAPTMAPVPTATTAPSATSAPTATTAAASEATINVANDPRYGKILVDGKGMTLYMYTKDEADKANCSGNCLKNWPPLLTLGAPKLGDGVDAKLVGSAKLADGTSIVTYNKMPLYYWVKDAKAGDVSGLGVNDAWYFVSPAGKVVGMEAVLNVATDPKLGKILVGANGMTLYMYTKDDPNKSNCADACLKAWPPLLTYGKPKLGDGVDAKLVGSATLADGTSIVTYNKMPLYYWAKDAKAGDVTGQNVNNVWYVVAPDGKVVGMDVVLNVATDAKLGKYLVDQRGMALYMFTKDEANKSNCSGDCLKAWPPFLSAGSPKAGAGVDQNLIGTAKLADGTLIVTYNKMPLYYWAADVKAGDVTGQDVNKVWYVVSPDGKVIK